MSHARVEEVSDSDPDDMDPSDFDPTAHNSIITPADLPAIRATSSTPRRQPAPSSAQPAPRAPPTQYAPPSAAQTQSSMPLPPQISQGRNIPRTYQCLYPVYFDKRRTRAQGRKINRKIAVENPLAKDILDAVQLLGLKVGFEPDKLHPKDWANPGRVRVLLKDEDGQLSNEDVKSKHHLYVIVAQYLLSHPSTEESPFRLRLQGMPMPDKPVPAPVAPRGWKMGTVLPLHSPALTGGGISDNPFKEAMAEMQGQHGIPSAPVNEGGSKKKKDKKKGKA